LQGCDSSGRFVFEPAETQARPTVLYEEHLKQTDKSHIAPFAGYLMPLWYSSIAAEHAAVRQAAGIFDCTHMGVLEVAGGDAASFLDSATTNEVGSLELGRARYAYILDAAGNVLDDIIVYRRGPDRFMVVVNAANEPKIKAYFSLLQKGEVLVDVQEPTRRVDRRCTITDMRDAGQGEDLRVDIALQGPNSADILLALTATGEAAERISTLKTFALTEQSLGGINCLISTTGYTGAKTGFELFVHPDRAVELWRLLLETGGPVGLAPCGLGSRDSLRIEAGLPLYGHELAGPFNISPFEAGYGWAVKLQKEFFIGKRPMQEIASTYQMMVARVELPGGRGVRPVRQNDGVLTENGKCAGWVLSCAKAADKQVALIYVGRDAFRQNDAVGVYYLARSNSQIQQGRKQSVRMGQQMQADAAGTVVSRFAKF
jgi:glycine cleavage system T protein